MENLKKYAPAQVIAITSTDYPQLKKFIKFTTMDLLIRGILKIKTNDLDVMNICVGPEFKKHQPIPLEEPIISIFLEDDQIRLIMNRFVKLTFENAKSIKPYLFERIIEQPGFSSFFNQGFWQRFLASIRLSEEGKELRRKLQAELDQLKVELPDMLKSNPEDVKKLIHEIGGNIFLVDGFDWNELKKLNFDLPTSERAGDDMWLYMFMFTDFGSSFDTQVDDFSSSTDGGGDSGCSGCGGCGG